MKSTASALARVSYGIGETLQDYSFLELKDLNFTPTVTISSNSLEAIEIRPQLCSICMPEYLQVLHRCTSQFLV